MAHAQDMEQRGTKGPPRWMVPAALIALAALLRLTWLGRESLWYDEVVVARISQAPLGEILSGRAGDLGNPPGFFALARLWRLAVGGSEAALRLLPALIGIASVALFYGFAREVLSRRAGRLATAFIALSPVHLYLSQELRMYSLLFLVTVALLWAAWRYARTGSRLALLGYGAAAVAGLYTHYYSGLVIAAVNVWVLLGRSDLRRKGLWLGAQAAVALLFLPWVPRFLHQLSVRSSEVSEGSSSRLHLFAAPLTLMFGRTLVWRDVPRRLFVVLPVICAGLWLVPLSAAWAGRCRGRWLLAASLLVPLPVIVLMVFVADVQFYDARKGLIFLPALALLFGDGALRLDRRVAVPLVGLCLGLMIASDALYFRRANRDEWRGLARHVTERAWEGDVAVFYPDIGETGFTCYAGPDAPATVRLSRVDAAGELHGFLGGEEHRRVADLTSYVFNHRRVWLVLDAHYLKTERYRAARELFLARSEPEAHWRFPRRLDLFLLRPIRVPGADAPVVEGGPAPPVAAGGPAGYPRGRPAPPRPTAGGD